jgi:hypothetical protein
MVFYHLYNAIIMAKTLMAWPCSKPTSMRSLEYILPMVPLHEHRDHGVKPRYMTNMCYQGVR